MALMSLKYKSGDGQVGTGDLVLVSIIPSSLTKSKLKGTAQVKKAAKGEYEKGQKFTGLIYKKQFGKTASLSSKRMASLRHNFMRIQNSLNSTKP